MATYLVLWKFTGPTAGVDAEPIRKAIAEGAPEVRRLAESYGGKLSEVYLTMGQYDGAAIAEFPDDVACARAMLAMQELGGRTETLRAFPEKEWGTLAADS